MKLMKKRDLFVIAGVLLAAAVIFIGYRLYSRNQPAKAEIYYESELIKTIPLKPGKDESFRLPQNEAVVFHLYEDGSIAFLESDCPDKVCIRSGRLKWAGQSAACLPNKLIVKIVPENGHSEDDVDMIG